MVIIGFENWKSAYILLIYNGQPIPLKEMIERKHWGSGRPGDSNLADWVWNPVMVSSVFLQSLYYPLDGS